TTSRTGTRSHTSGAVKPPSDCATTTMSSRSPMASTTTSAYSAKPALSSSTGRSGATTSCPRRASSGTTRCQYEASPPAPWINAYVAIGNPVLSSWRGHGYDHAARRDSSLGSARRLLLRTGGRLLAVLSGTRLRGGLPGTGFPAIRPVTVAGQQLGDPPFDAGGEHVDVGRRVVVAGDAEDQLAVVAEDRDADP